LAAQLLKKSKLQKKAPNFAPKIKKLCCNVGHFSPKRKKKFEIFTFSFFSRNDN
jgi:hypothetical protein